MYIDRIRLSNVRTFVKNDLLFVHPDSAFGAKEATDRSVLPRPRLPNVNLLLGDNGSGKTTVLQAIALSSLGPAAREAQLPLRPFVRFTGKRSRADTGSSDRAITEATLLLHDQDLSPGKIFSPLMAFARRGELERLEYLGDAGSDKEMRKIRPRMASLNEDSIESDVSRAWAPVFESNNAAFFCAAYGATRRVESGDAMESGHAPKSSFLRGQRLQSIFQDSFALFPLGYWLPQLKAENPGRYSQVVTLINKLLGPGHYRFTGEIKDREYLFDRGGMRVPYRSLSDGYRAFVAWVADLLYHICYGCPSGKKLTESAGVVLVDEIDLHLHPKWQMKAVGTVSRALPRMQFIFTSHSPLVAGSLEWMNIITLKTSSGTNTTRNRRLRRSIHGLDADQILLTDFFGMKSTIAPAKRRQLEDITARIRAGDRDAPLQLIRQMSNGTEGEEA